MVTRIRQEGFRNSKVMDYAAGAHGRRRRAPHRLAEHEKGQRMDARQADQDGSLERASRECKFGRGWTSDYTSVRMTLSRRRSSSTALPRAWSPATNGPITRQGRQGEARDEGRPREEQGQARRRDRDDRRAEGDEAAGQGRAGALHRRRAGDARQLRDPGPPTTRAWPSSRKRREFRKLLAQFAMDEKIAAGHASPATATAACSACRAPARGATTSRRRADGRPGARAVRPHRPPARQEDRASSWRSTSRAKYTTTT